jgi:tetratricopeptide (TPR) repeat protein
VLENLEGLGQEVRFEKAQVLNFMGKIAARRDLVESLRLHKQSLGLFKALGDRYWESDTLMEIGRNFHLWGRVKKAQEYLQRSLANFRELGDSRKIAENLLIFDWFFQRQGKFKEAERAARERLALFEMIGDRSAIADGQAELAGCLGALGDFYEAVRLAEKAIEIHQELEYFTEFFQDTKCLCFNMLDLGNYQQASDLARHALEWCGGRFSTISDRLEGDSEMRRIGIALTFQGMAMLALGNLSKAELFLQQSQTALKDVPPESVTLLHHSSLGIASLKSNKPDRSKVHILNGLLKGMEIKSAIVLLYAISCAALFLANQGDLERAVEIYALAKRYPWIAKSQWYQDVIEAPLNTLTDSLLPEVIATAQQRGRERDLEETVQELITELA